MRLSSLVSIGAAAVTLSSCATIFAKHTVSIPIGSDPTGADVYVDGSRVGTSPTTVEVVNRKPHVITVRKAGHKEATCRIETGTGVGWIVLDVLGGLIPVIIDAATGEWNSLKTKTCNVNLVTEG